MSKNIKSSETCGRTMCHRLLRIMRQRALRRREILRFYVAQKRALLRDERGAVTVEYAILITAAVAIAGVLVAIVQSPEIRQMLLNTIQDALHGAGH